MDIIVSKPEYAVGIAGKVVFVQWRQQVVAEGIAQLEETVRRTSSTSGARIGLMVIIDAPDLPDRTHRELMQQSLNRVAGCIGVMATAVRVPGLMGTAVRTILNGMRVLARATYDHRAFADVDAAAEWLHTALAALGSPTGAAVSELVENATAVTQSPI